MSADLQAREKLAVSPDSGRYVDVSVPVIEPEWTTVIESRSRWFDPRIGELWRYRDLIGLFIRRDFVAQYKQTILGPAWHIIQPLLTSIVFAIVFGGIAKLSTDGTPPFLFYMSGTIAWTYFSHVITKCADIFISNAGVFGKVYFPRLTVPVSVVISNMISFGVQFLFFLCILAYFMITGAEVKPNAWAFLTPVLLMIMAALGLGMGIIVSAMTTRYRDLKFLIHFGIQLAMYATPVIYPASSIPERYRWIIIANPLTPVIETFRYSFLGAGTVSPLHLLYSLGVASTVLLIGAMIFNRIERTFDDTI